MLKILTNLVKNLLSDPEADDAIEHLLAQQLIRTDGKSLTGYDIHCSTGLPFRRIYPSLNRLEKQGSIGYSVARDKESGLRRRYYFRISPYWEAHK